MSEKREDKICVLVGAGEMAYKRMEGLHADCLIAVDAGLEVLEKMGLHADYVVGDFDSLGHFPGDKYSADRVFTHPIQKDDTDMALAVKMALERGYRKFYILGATGKRLDHTIANMQLLSYIASEGAEGFLLGEDETIAVLKDATYQYSKEYKGTISVFCATDQVKGVNLTGLKYPLKDAMLNYRIPLGVSNEFLGEEALVTVREGTIWILWEGNTELELPKRI